VFISRERERNRNERWVREGREGGSKRTQTHSAKRDRDTEAKRNGDKRERA
jgi:hypothetical protein